MRGTWLRRSGTTKAQACHELKTAGYPASLYTVKWALHQHGLRVCDQKALLQNWHLPVQLKFAAAHMDEPVLVPVVVVHCAVDGIMKRDYLQILQPYHKNQQLNGWNMNTAGWSNRTMIPNRSKFIWKRIKKANVKLLEARIRLNALPGNQFKWTLLKTCILYNHSTLDKQQFEKVNKRPK